MRPKRDDAADLGGEARRLDGAGNSELRLNRSTNRQRERRFLAVAAKPNGQRTIMCSSRDRGEVEAFVAKHRPFAVAAGGGLTVEVDDMVVVEARR
jgi:hypothetical protein